MPGKRSVLSVDSVPAERVAEVYEAASELGE